MKENEVINEEPKKSFGQAMAGLPKAAWTAETKLKGVNLETLMHMFYNSDASGEELTSKLEGFKYAKRLKDLTNIAFAGIKGDWNDVMIDAESAEELWAKKYAHVTDKDQKELMYQLELLNQIFNGTSEIDVEGNLVVSQGSRQELRSEIMNEYNANKPASKVDDEPEPSFEEDEPEANADEPEAIKDSLDADAFKAFSENAYDRVIKSNGAIGIAMEPVAMVGAMLNGKNSSAEIIESYKNFRHKKSLDNAIDNFMKEIDNPERAALLKEQGIDIASTIRVEGQTLAERYGEKYKDVEDLELKERLCKMELMNEIGNAFMMGKKGHMPVITADTFVMENGNFVKAEPMSVTVEKPKRQVVVEDVEAEKHELTPEELKAEVMAKTESLLYKPEAPLRGDVVLSDGLQSKWSALKQIHSIHNELKNAAERLDAEKKGSKDTAFYEEMRNALEDCVKYSDIENSEANIAKFNDAMGRYVKASETYYKERKGLIFGPATDVGKLRLKEAKEAMDKYPALMDSLKGTVGYIDEDGFASRPLVEIARDAINEAREAGSNKFSLREFEGKFGPEYMEDAAKKYLKDAGKAINTQSVADLAFDGGFITVVESNPAGFIKDYEHYLAACEFLTEHYKAIYNDKTLDEKARRDADTMSRGEKFHQKALALAGDPQFIENYENKGSSFVEAWENKMKAEAYLNVKNGVAPTFAEVKALSENKIFRMIAGKNPTEFANKWDANAKKANELKEKYKQELENLTYGLKDYEGSLATYVKDYYEPNEEEAAAYEEAMEGVKARKEAIKEEKMRIFDARQELEDMEDSPEKEEKKAQIDKDAEALDKTVKAYKQDKANVITEHLLPGFLARVAFLKATQDPVAGDDICRLMATSANQEEAVCDSILDNIKKPENAKLLKDNSLKEAIENGSIVERLVPGVKKEAQGAKPEAAKKNIQSRKSEAAPRLGV